MGGGFYRRGAGARNPRNPAATDGVSRTMRAALPLLVLLPAFQDSRDVAKAAEATIAKGSFTFHAKPAADLRDAMAQDRAAVAGVPVTGELLSDGTYHATDGTHELWGRGARILLKTKERWRPAEEVAKELLEAIGAGVGEEWRQGNVTKAREAWQKLFAIAHLAVRSVPPTHLLSGLESDFKTLKKGPVDASKNQVYEGELKDLAASKLLEGPYGELVKSGTVRITDFGGRGRVWVGPDGLVRRVEQRAAGRYTVTTKDAKRTVPAAMEVVTEFVKIGETRREVPAEVASRLSEAGR